MLTELTAADILKPSMSRSSQPVTRPTTLRWTKNCFMSNDIHTPIITNPTSQGPTSQEPTSQEAPTILARRHLGDSVNKWRGLMIDITTCEGDARGYKQDTTRNLERIYLKHRNQYTFIRSDHRTLHSGRS